MDIATVAGISAALFAIIGGFMLEGGHMGSIMQGTAAIIVCGGTLGAALVQFPLDHVIGAAKGLKDVFLPKKDTVPDLVRNIVGFAEKARREGVVALESEADKVADPILKKALALAVDGSESRIIRDAIEIEQQIAAEHGEAAPKVFEAAGGYAPTVGILGAVLGLIHVMENLADPSKLGAGIAVAFVATVYGVALANLFLLPMAGKLKIRHAQSMLRFDVIITGVTAIVDGENPRLIEQKLQGFVGEHGHGGAKATPLKKAA